MIKKISFKFFSSFSSLKINYQQYFDNGYIVIPNLISSKEIDNLKTHTEKLIEQQDFSKEIGTFKANQNLNTKFRDSASSISYFFEEIAVDSKEKNIKLPPKLALNKIGHAMHDVDPVFHSFSYKKEFKEILQNLNYINPSLIQTMYIFKNQKIGAKVDPHSDNTYLITKPLSTCGFWIALDDASKTNGCLWGVPKSHKKPTTYFMKMKNNQLESYYEETESEKNSKSYSIENSVALEVKKGSLIVFHGDFVHFSADNLSKESRNAYTMHFIERNNCVWEDFNWLQRNEKLPFVDYYSKI